MIDEHDARRRILDATPRGGVDCVPLASAGGSVAARALTGRVDLPGFDNSAMDGYAVIAAEAQAGARLRVAGEQPAGRDRGLQVAAGEGVRIFTGAPMPAGADAVVMQEDVRREGDEIEIVEGVKPGEFVRRRGGDVCVGQKLFDAGDRITAARVALLASQGIAEVEVFAAPRVAVLTTGDELRAPGDGVELAAGEIFNSNAAMLAALVERFGGRLAGCNHAGDEAGELRACLREAMDGCDLLLVAGGVSVGEHDLVKAELAALGVAADFWRVRVKPGKPFVFGRRERQLVFGLPGNPVSAFTTFLLFAAPAMRRWAGHGPDLVDAASAEDLPLPAQTVVAGEVLRNRGDRPHYLRGRVDSTGRFVPVGMQQSHAIHGLSRATALVRLDAGAEVAEGAALRIWSLEGI